MRAVLLALLLASCAAPPVPPPAGPVPPDLAALEDPAAAVGARVAAMDPHLALLDAGGPGAQTAREELRRLGEEICLLCGRDFLDGHPLLRSELRTLALFAGDPDPATRAHAIGRLRSLVQQLPR
jgi:hypothetical protein